ncbi:MAG: phospholipase D-like domain-containing protein [Candidatus Omnitrophica bacterium]|nr:phospholipase D-like domain-containing protein [Candidatus Omnitrophota bacterium]
MIRSVIWRQTLLIAALVVLTLTSRVFCYEAQVENISGTRYFPAVKQAIAQANKSIYLVMFTVESSASKQSKPGELVGLLIEAAKRGVEVRVVLDQNVDYVSWDPRIKSTNAFRRLKDAGVDVRYDEPARYTHAKAVVIDQKTVILGSTNWTENSFDNNIETDVKIESPELAREMLEYFQTIKIDESVPKLLEPRANSVGISRHFLDDPGIGPFLVKEQAERAFDLYLYLLWKFAGDAQGQVNFFYDDAAKYLGIYQGWTPENYRRQINDLLRKLEDKFQLIRFQPRYGKEPAITLLDYEDPQKPYQLPNEKQLLIPGEYFERGWSRQLSLRAKFCYLINLAYTADSDIKPFWSKSVLTITRQCGGVGQDVIIKGMQELRHSRLLEARYDQLGNKPYDTRRPKMYKLLDLYDPAQRDQDLAQLQTKYGPKQYAQARQYAAIVFEENDPRVVEEIITLIQERGPKKVAQAFQEVAQKNIDNPKRTYIYTLGIIDAVPNPSH